MESRGSQPIRGKSKGACKSRDRRPLEEDEESDDVEIVREDIIEKLETGIGDAIMQSNLDQVAQKVPNIGGFIQDPQAMIRKPKVRASDQLKSFTVPQAEYSAFENPSSEFIEDYSGILEDHGVNIEDVRQIASAYDRLR